MVLFAEFPGREFPGREFPGREFPGREFPGREFVEFPGCVRRTIPVA